MRLICVSNRLPVTIDPTTEPPSIRPSSGGLVTALSPVLKRSGGVWMGWTGQDRETSDGVRELLAEASVTLGFDLAPVNLSPEHVRGFYSGFSNQIIWPLFHDLQSRCNFDPDYWSAYLKVKDEFAFAIQDVVKEGDLIWVHDYHLMGLGRTLRDNGISNQCCYFLHIPFPPPDIFCKLPWRQEVIESLLRYDSVGVQTYRDLNNLADCIQLLTSYEVVRRQDFLTIKSESRETTIGTFPISIDFDEFEQPALTELVQLRAEEIRRDMGVEHLIVSVDRLDYTKGIPYRLRAFHRMLFKYPELARSVALMQVLVPSREEVTEYKQLKLEIEQLVSQTNGAFGQPGWVPIHHFFRSLSRDELIATYLAADVALVTPLKDGMNLVAKEFCAANFRENGVLVLSEFAGAAEELGEDAVLVNPYDFDGVADALKQALFLSVEERQVHMRKLREKVRRFDVFHWASTFLRTAKVPASILGDEPSEAVPLVSRIRRLLTIFQSRTL